MFLLLSGGVQYNPSVSEETILFSTLCFEGALNCVLLCHLYQIIVKATSVSEFSC